jgi:pentatricopeptide repeat protein
MAFTVFEAIAETIVGAQIEIAVFIAAVLAHVFLFKKRQTQSDVRKGKQLKQVEAAPKACKDADAASRAAPRVKPMLQAALAAPDLKDAARLLAAIPEVQRGAGDTVTFALTGALQQLSVRAVSQCSVPLLLEELHAHKALNSWSLEVVLVECTRQGHKAGHEAAVRLSRSTGTQITATGYAALVRGACSSGEALTWFQEASTKGLEVDIATRVVMLKRLGTDGRLEDMLGVLESCTTKQGCLYNAVIDAFVGVKDMRTAQRLAAEALEAGVADVITSNTIIKAHLHNGNLSKARTALAEMRKLGMDPNVVTYNEFLDAAVGTAGGLPWAIVDEMLECGLKPNAVTCSILLKTVTKNCKAADIQRIASLLESLEQGEMDEVLLSSACEAGIRSNQVEFLRRQLQSRRASQRVIIKGAPAFGSIIRAYGFIGDIEGVWDTWREMRARRVLPTSITLGCMVEAVVGNAGPEAGYKMIQEAASDDETRPLLNAIIYCSVMKGFSHQKNFDRMWEVYQEVLEGGHKCSIVTYNTMVDACARCNEMARVPELLQHMDRQGIKPNVVTYGAIIKGYVQENKVDQALALLSDMKKNTAISPDEIAYNTVLDGCARNGFFDRGLEILKEMESTGVTPTNFTLSVLVKLCNRARRLESAFELCQAVSERHSIRPNIHVYNNLMFACVGHAQLPRALQVLKRAVAEKNRPDARTYTILLRGCVSAKQPDDAAGLLRAAYGLHGAHEVFAPAALTAKLQGGLPSELIAETLEGIARMSWEKRDLAIQLVRELQSLPSVRLHSSVIQRLTGT